MNNPHSGLPARVGAGRTAMLLGGLAILCTACALAALAGLAGLLGSHPQTTEAVLDAIRWAFSDAAADSVAAEVGDLMDDAGTAFAVLAAGLAGTAAFATMHLRAYRRAAGGRPLRTTPSGTVLRTCVAMLLVMAALCALATGPVAAGIADAAGISTGARLAWDLAKWLPLLVATGALMAITQRAALAARPSLRPLSPRLIAGTVAWCLAITGFVVFLANVDSFTDVYGGIGTAAVLVGCVTLFSILFRTTPDLRRTAVDAVGPGALVAAAGWLAWGGALAAWTAAFDAVAEPFWVIGAIAIVLAGAWASQLALLLGTRLTARRIAAAATAAAVADAGAELAGTAAAALVNTTAHERLSSVLARRARPLSELEADMMDWGFAFGVAWAVARRRDPTAPEELISARALSATQTVFHASRGRPAPHTRGELPAPAPDAGTVETRRVSHVPGQNGHSPVRLER